VDIIGINLKKMVELTIEQATAIANILGTLPANQCYNEITILLQAINKAQQPKSE
jgi:hypothetical protein